MRCVKPDPFLAPHHPKLSPVMQRIQHLRRGMRRAAPVILHPAVREMFLDFSRMDDAALIHEIEQQPLPFPLRRRFRPTPLRRHFLFRPRMHQRLQLPRHIAVVDEEILLDPQRFILPLQIACPISLHPLAAESNPAPSPAPESDPPAQISSAPAPGRSVVGAKERPRHRISPQIIER